MTGEDTTGENTSGLDKTYKVPKLDDTIKRKLLYALLSENAARVNLTEISRLTEMPESTTARKLDLLGNLGYFGGFVPRIANRDVPLVKTETPQRGQIIEVPTPKSPHELLELIKKEFQIDPQLHLVLGGINRTYFVYGGTNVACGTFQNKLKEYGFRTSGKPGEPLDLSYAKSVPYSPMMFSTSVPGKGLVLRKV